MGRDCDDSRPGRQSAVHVALKWSTQRLYQGATARLLPCVYATIAVYRASYGDCCRARGSYMPEQVAFVKLQARGLVQVRMQLVHCVFDASKTLRCSIRHGDCRLRETHGGLRQAEGISVLMMAGLTQTDRSLLLHPWR